GEGPGAAFARSSLAWHAGRASHPPVPRSGKMRRTERNCGMDDCMTKRWASDVIVDLLHMHELPYAALNPGASYRGLHDSIGKYGDTQPVMMRCQHEETTVQIAHGYAKASGKPMVAI